MNTEPSHGELSLEQIERDMWGDSPVDATRLIRTAYNLRRKPVAALTAEDLRLLIGQSIGIEVLVPRALALLDRNPLVEGDYYSGDLLVAVLALPVTYWNDHPDQSIVLREIVEVIKNIDPKIQDNIDKFLEILGSTFGD